MNLADRSGIFEVGFTFGWRDSEITNLQVRQINLADGAIRLDPGETKNDDGRLVKMPARLQTLLAALIAGKKPKDPVFTRGNGKPVRDFRDAWEQITTQAGVPEPLFHDLRRTAVRNMVRYS